MNINYQLLVDIVLVSGALSFVLNTRSKMIQIIASSTQSNLLIYVGGGGFILLGSFFFGRLVTFFFPKNPLIRNGKKRKS
jgi:hypothetical protein|tara:strand:- start:277 stop:516 length:240 start_codon:yes stop_codon:yes gene_type:complete